MIVARTKKSAAKPPQKTIARPSRVPVPKMSRNRATSSSRNPSPKNVKRIASRRLLRHRLLFVWRSVTDSHGAVRGYPLAATGPFTLAFVC